MNHPLQSRATRYNIGIGYTVLSSPGHVAERRGRRARPQVTWRSDAGKGPAWLHTQPDGATQPSRHKPEGNSETPAHPCVHPLVGQGVSGALRWPPWSGASPQHSWSPCPLPARSPHLPQSCMCRIGGASCPQPLARTSVPLMPEEGEPIQRRQMVHSTASCPGSRTDPRCRQPQLEASRAGRHSHPSWGAISLWTPPLERGLEGHCWADTPALPAGVLTAWGLVQTTRPL